ncbi:MAG: type II toxin-antitoxin system PemK/MazF family toxin [Lachnospiraceae bacterium]
MKNNITALPRRGENRAIKRGDIYYADLCGLEQSVGSEQTGRRPVLIIQNDIGNIHSPTTIVAILTTKIKRNLPTHVVIREFAGLSQVSAVCLEQIKTIDKSRLEKYCGNVGNEMMQEIEQAIFISLGTRKDLGYERVILDAKEEVNRMDLVRRETAFDDIHCDWLQVAREQMIFFADIKQYMVNLEVVRRNLDNEIEDILDYIESTNYNVAQGYKIYRMLRERRKQRKEVLQELSQLQALTEAFECDQMRKVYQSAIAKMQHVETEKRKSTVIQQLLEQEVS